MGQLSKYVWRYWRYYLVGGLCLFGTATLVMWIPWWIREAISIVEHGGELSDVTYYAVLIIASAIVQGLVRTFSRALIFNAGRNVEFDLRNDLFAHLEKLPLSYYHSQRTGDLMSRVINDISAVRVMLGPGILNFVNAPLYYVYAVALMLSMDVRMTLAALAPFPLLIYVARKFRGQIMKSSLEVQQQMSVLSSHVQENLSGMHVVKAYSQEEFPNPAVCRLEQGLRSQKHGDGEDARHRQSDHARHQRPDGADRHLVRRHSGDARRLAGRRYCRLYRLSQRAGVADRRVRLDAFAGRARPRRDAPSRRNSRNSPEITVRNSRAAPRAQRRHRIPRRLLRL